MTSCRMLFRQAIMKRSFHSSFDFEGDPAMPEPFCLSGSEIKRKRFIKWGIGITLTASVLSVGVVFAAVRIRESTRKLDVV